MLWPGSVRVRIKRRGRTVTRTVRLRRGVVRVPTARSTRAGRWTVSVLGPNGKIGSGKVTIRRR
jgi:hypothetical protein